MTGVVVSDVQDLADVYLEQLLELAAVEHETLRQVAARAPPGDPVHRLAATTVRCGACAWIGPLSDLRLDQPDCIVHCPRCDASEWLSLMAEGSA